MAYSNRGVTYAALGQHTKALADYDAAIRIDLSYAKAHYNRGNSYKALGRHAEALADYAAAIHLDPNFASAYLSKGALHTERDEWDDALLAFEIAARLGDPKGAQYVARVRQMLGASSHRGWNLFPWTRKSNR
jgi:tetratricopeptide (TPR) repeat protein